MDNRSSPASEHAEVFLFYRDGCLFHIHTDRTVFEEWMEKSPWQYPTASCRIVRYIPDARASLQPATPTEQLWRRVDLGDGHHMYEPATGGDAVAGDAQAATPTKPAAWRYRFSGAEWRLSYDKPIGTGGEIEPLYPAQLLAAPIETKLVYIKRWRTIVNLPAKYADEIVEALRTPDAAQPEAATPPALTGADLGRWCYENPNLAALTIEGLRGPAQQPLMQIAAPGNDQLSKLWNAIVENTKGDGFWIGEILLTTLEREVGFNPAGLSPSSTESK